MTAVPGNAIETDQQTLPHPIENVALAAVWLLVCAWFVASLLLPFGWDQGIIASVGDVVVRGGLPYRDAWDMKGPAAPLTFALAQVLFGRTMWGIRVFDLVLMMGSALVVGRLVARLVAPRAAAWAVAAYLLWYACHGWFFTAQPDGWVAAILAVGLAPLVGGQRPASTRLLAAAGLAAGVSALVKPFYLLLALVPLVAIGFDRPRGRRSRSVAAVVAAALLPWCLATGWFWLRGGLDHLLEVHVAYAATVYRSQDGATASRAFLWMTEYFVGLIPRSVDEIFWYQTPVFCLPLIALGVWRVCSLRRTAWLLGLWLTVLIVGIMVQNRFYPYHMFPLFPVLMALAGVGMDRTGFRRGFGVAAATAGAVFLLGVAVPVAGDVVRGAGFIAGRIDAESYYSRFTEAGYVAGDELKAADVIRSTTLPSDRVFMFGNNATATYLSGRPLASRFTFNMPLLMDGPMREPYRRELLGALSMTPPALLIIGLPWAGEKAAALQGFPELKALLDDQYSIERRIGLIDIYRRRSAGTAGRPLMSGVDRSLAPSPRLP
jgi:hypothetical protein